MNTNDFYFENSAPLPLGGTARKFQYNLDAVKILKACRFENRSATPEEQAALSMYTGWGDGALLRKLLWEREGEELRKLLDTEEMQAARGSSLNAHYTALPVIGAMWDAVRHLGADQLSSMKVGDFSAGIGHFKSCMPSSLRDKSQWVEVELDQLTAGILDLLHPGSTIHAAGFEKIKLPAGWFDLAISNVPFGDYGVNFKGLHAFMRGSIHNFFFGRTVSLLRPGGVMAFITSRYTLDAKDDLVRNWLATYMDLMAAVRLPDTSFKENAGTEVVTDIIFLRKRSLERTTTEGLDWLDTEMITIKSEHGNNVEHSINEYFIRNPHMVIGNHSTEGKMYSRDSYTVKAREGADLGDAIREALCSAMPSGILAEQTLPVVSMPEKRKVTVITSPDEKRSPEVMALLDIYRTARKLLAADAEGDINAETLRDSLCHQYDAFVVKHGPITANLKSMVGTPEEPFLKALEWDYNPATMTARKAGLFTSSVVRALSQAAINPSPSDALVISLEQKGKVDMPYICDLTGQEVGQVTEALQKIIYQTPTNEWQTADEYLSGNVRKKLVEAETISALDSRYNANIEALRSVLPAPLAASQIHAQLGSGWIPEKMIEEFIRHLLNADYIVKYIPEMAHWEVNMRTRYGYVVSGLMYQKWGTGRCSAINLIDDALNSRIPYVYDVEKDGDGETRVVNSVETMAAQAKQAEVRDDFEKWLWTEEVRRSDMERIYNETFRSFVARRYDGSHLAFPGLRSTIKPRQSQKDVAWRILQNKSTAMIHEVGMGKTLSSIISVMEAHRLGISRKAMVVVPNHLLASWNDAVLWAYPNANVLCATARDMKKENRGAFLSRIATNDWDFVIVPFSSFKLLPTQPDTVSVFYQKEIDRLEEYLYELKGDKDSVHVVKQIEKTKKRFQLRLDKLADMQKDSQDTICFEQMGIDFLLVDEHHSFKNLFFSTKMTRIAGLPNSESQRAFDMFVKSRWTMAHGGKFVGATGTPVTNTLAEMFTMQRYFQSEILEELGLSHFDAWTKMFAVAEPGLEMTPDGSGFRMNTRFRRFVNVPELSRIWAQVADTRRVDKNSGIERPDLWGGKPIKVRTYAGDALKEFTIDLANRADKIRAGLVQPWQDNMLKVTSDGRKAALDMSLVVPAPDGAAMPKIDALVDLAAEIFFASTPTLGTQLIFCDLATPKAR